MKDLEYFKTNVENYSDNADFSFAALPSFTKLQELQKVKNKVQDEAERQYAIIAEQLDESADDYDRTKNNLESWFAGVADDLGLVTDYHESYYDRPGRMWVSSNCY